MRPLTRSLSLFAMAQLACATPKADPALPSARAHTGPDGNRQTGTRSSEQPAGGANINTAASAAHEANVRVDHTRTQNLTVRLYANGNATFHDTREVAGVSVATLQGFPRDTRGLWVAAGTPIYRHDLQQSLAERPKEGDEATRDRVFIAGRPGARSLEGQMVQLREGRVAFLLQDVEKQDEHPETPSLQLALGPDHTTPSSVTLTYASQKLSHAMEYVLVRQASAERATLGGAIRLENRSGAALRQAKLSVSDTSIALSAFGFGTMATSKGTTLTLSAPISLDGDAAATFPVFDGREVSLSRKLVAEGPGFPTFADIGEVGGQEPQAVLDAETVDGKTVSDQGMVRGQSHLYMREGAYFGTATARPLPGGVGLRVQLGRDQGLDVRRRLLQKRTLKRCVAETSWEIRLHNTTDAPIAFQDVEPVTGVYELIDSSVPTLAREADHFAFGGQLAPGAEQRLTFRVRVTGCEQGGPHQYWGGKPSMSVGKWGSDSK